jgi:competence protein ComEC
VQRNGASAGYLSDGFSVFGIITAMDDRRDGHSVETPGPLRSGGDGRGLWPALGMAAGIAAAAAWPMLGPWLIAGLVCLLIALGFLVFRRDTGGYRAVACWGLLAWVALSGSWFIVRDQHVGPNHISNYLAEEPRLLRVVGTVEGPPKIAPPGRGAFASFAYQRPETFFVLSVRRVQVIGDAGSAWRRGAGRVLGKIEAADHRLRSGMHVEAAGWAARFGTPVNPGERDYAQMMRRRGMAGRLTLVEAGNWRPADAAVHGQPPAWNFAGLSARWQSLRQRINRTASDSLAIGLSGYPQRAELFALLDRVLLGRWSDELDELEEQFRRVGLAHLLAISGAHLGVLLSLAWLVTRGVGLRPNRAAVLVLLVLGLYLMAVPVKVPVARAALMALLLLGGFAAGRGGGALSRLGLAAILLLLWRPGDLFDPGFQLSFVTVAALIRYTAPVSRWLMPEPPFVDERPWWRTPLRRAADALAVSIVAFTAATPIVAYHFQLVSPLSIGMSMAALPLFIAMLSLGYVKALVGIVLPSVSLMLAEPLAWCGGAMAWLVRWVHELPMSSFDLAVQPSVAWVTAALVLGAAVFQGLYARRRGAMLASIGVLLAWGGAQQHPDAVAAVLARDRPAIRLNTLSVGDGSCHLVRAGGHTLMFDCGSGSYPLIGRNSVVPALRALGVAQLDTLVISHSDLDHFAGVPDLIEQIDVGRVLIPPQLIAEATDNPEGTTAHLLAELRRRQVSIESITRGWRARHGGVDFAALWPPAAFTHERDNETSVVLRIAADEARLLLVGDIEATAMTALLESGDDLRATVMEVPHHGSFVEASPRFVQAVSPRLLVQSAGPRWDMSDKWPATLREQGIDRLVTDEVGMIEAALWRDGRLRRGVFRDDHLAGAASEGTSSD